MINVNSKKSLPLIIVGGICLVTVAAALWNISRSQVATNKEEILERNTSSDTDPFYSVNQRAPQKAKPKSEIQANLGEKRMQENSVPSGLTYSSLGDYLLNYWIVKDRAEKIAKEEDPTRTEKEINARVLELLKMIEPEQRSVMKKRDAALMTRLKNQFGLDDSQQVIIEMYYAEQRDKLIDQFQELTVTNGDNLEEMLRGTLNDEQLKELENTLQNNKENRIAGHVNEEFQKVQANLNLDNSQQNTMRELLRSHAELFETAASSAPDFDALDGLDTAVYDGMKLYEPVRNERADISLEALEEARLQYIDDAVEKASGVLTPTQSKQYRTYLEGRISGHNIEPNGDVSIRLDAIDILYSLPRKG